MLLRWHTLRNIQRTCYNQFRFIQTQSPYQRRKDLIPTADTIYALSTASGRAAIAVVRITGPACLDIYGGLCPHRPFPIPRTATLRKLIDPDKNNRVLDAGALVLYFPAPKTVTGEDVLELHVHGGSAIVKSVLDAIPRCIDSRPRRRTAEYSFIRAAEPGEFTKRAFYNGRIDLTQAEALGEILSAETEQQRRLAVASSGNTMTTRYEEWRQLLLYARGELEALIDFSEDQHFDESPDTFISSITNQVQDLARRIKLHIINASRGEMLRNGIDVALLGAPNAGKSSLLNRIVGREAAIVSSEPGTTRDIVDIGVDIGGWLVKLGDTAGLRTSGMVGAVEKEGIRRALERASQADVIVCLMALKRSTDGAVELEMDDEVSQTIRNCRDSGKTVIYVVNKTDLASADMKREQIISALPGASTTSPVYFVSCKEAGQPTTETDPGGIQNFLQGLTTVFTTMTSAATGQEGQAYWNTSLAVTHRQREYLRQCLSHLRDFSADLAGEIVKCGTGLNQKCNTKSAPAPEDHPPTSADPIEKQDLDVVQAAEHLRYAADCLAKITGRGSGADVEEVLGVVFEK